METDGYSALFCGRPWAFSGLLILLSLAVGHQGPILQMRTLRPRAVKSLSASGQSRSRLRPSSSWGRGLNSGSRHCGQSRPGVYLLLNSLRPRVGRFWSRETPRWEQAWPCPALFPSGSVCSGLRPGDQWSGCSSHRLGRWSRLQPAGEVGSHLMLGAGGGRPLPGGGRLFSVMTALAASS